MPRAFWQAVPGWTPGRRPLPSAEVKACHPGWLQKDARETGPGGPLWGGKVGGSGRGTNLSLCVTFYLQNCLTYMQCCHY